MTTLPTDVLIGVLSRLPVKSLCKFKCVSKEWLQIITDPQFICLHRELFSEVPYILLARMTNVSEETTRIDFSPRNFDGSRENADFSMHVRGDEDEVRLVPSNGGDLICFTSGNDAYVCNPSTQVMKKLPEASFCPFDVINAATLGYLKDRAEYVLVLLFYVLGEVQCGVMRLKDGEDYEWKLLDATCPYRVYCGGVVVDNVFFWMSLADHFDQQNLNVVSFDPEKEEFQTIMAPEGYYDEDSLFVVELQGKLCLADTVAHYSMSIWVLEDAKEHAWLYQYSIDISYYPSIFIREMVRPVEYLDDKLLLMRALPHSIDYYDLKKREYKRMDGVAAQEWHDMQLCTQGFFKK